MNVTDNSQKSKGLLLVYCLLLSLLSACDGGIFGTSDGENPETSNASSASGLQGIESNNTDSDNGEQNSAGTDENGHSNGNTDATVDAVSNTTPPQQAFENLQLGSASVEPQISLINVTRRSLMVAGQNLPSVTPNSASAWHNIALNSTRLRIIDDASLEELVNISPLNLGAYSASTFITRDRPTSASPESNDNSGQLLEVLALATQRIPSADGMARLRLVQAAPLDAEDTPASMRLVPAGPQPGSTESDLGIMSSSGFATASSSYQTFSAGSYELVDSLNRIDPQPVELAAGQFYTLVLRSSATALFIRQDSQ